MPFEDADSSFDTWSAMFDSLCIEQGHHDNAELAQRYCALAGATGETAYEAAVKNIGNWRRGVHVPHRKNFAILTRMLDVDASEPLLADWDRLYADAKQGRKETTEALADNEPVAAPKGQAATNRKTIALAVIAVAAIAVGVVYMQAPSLFDIKGDDATQAQSEPIDMTGQRIYWREVVELSVGEAVVVHGKRGRCGEQPPPWEEVLKFLPELSTGVWLDGGVGYRVSRSCGGTTPSRAVVFKATQPGVDKIFLYDDPITLTVN